MNANDYVKQLLPSQSLPSKVTATAFAASNIALCKYWGKRNQVLNLPVTSSLSMSLKDKGTQTTVSLANESQLIVNGQIIHKTAPMAQRLWGFIDYCLPQPYSLKIVSESNLPLAAGLASSASCFASLVLALNDFFAWQLSLTELSLLARLGSGSACRSFWPGFVEWQKGEDAAGSDSYAYPLDVEWPELCIGLLLFSAKPKPFSSTEAMNITVATSPLYQHWPQQVTEHLKLIKQALQHKDFHLLGQVVEANALAMHATMKAATPSIDYNLPATIACYNKLVQLRRQGIPVYATQDAGPNLKLLFEYPWYKTLLTHFPTLQGVVSPIKKENSNEYFSE